jgi:2,4-dichlorophenol 6-monooxygenase
MELGYRYRSGAMLDDGLADAPSDRDPELYYSPTTRPGARVPHARLERAGAALSTLDLPTGLRFALLTGCGGQAWHEASTDLPVDVHLIGAGDLLDPYGEWAARREVASTGAVLVRPDRHVAWRCDRLPADPTSELAQVIRQLLATTPDPTTNR